MVPSDYPVEIQNDWVTRENSETICTSLKTVVEFLNRFHSSCRLKLAEMDNRLKILEKKIERLDAISKGVPNPLPCQPAVITI
ncbi:unnamed protein product [Mesocestoides corti]|uniref:Protein BRICK1 n=1 Tax=Mesocestoides corti TaxID=53468 RepID=A0A0R3UIB1_MESCO|nr:unnamed protein product [Mesocestoides corti]